ncbi:bacteriocin-type signal sequence-containing protein [Ruminococcus sp. XPD3002]|nr:bacteriocin-type signal sequence-containing protein [Ruminococcus flavefaciens]
MKKCFTELTKADLRKINGGINSNVVKQTQLSNAIVQMILKYRRK